MVALYLTSWTKGSGKTAIGAGLGKHLLDEGKKVGFFKPSIAEGKNAPQQGADSDAVLMKQVFALEEPAGLLCPVFDDVSNMGSQIKEAYAKVAQGKEVVIVEGLADPLQISRDIVAALDARVIIVEDYSPASPQPTKSYQDFGRYLLGVVLNKVPRRRMEQVHGEVSASFAKMGVKILGVLPEDRSLFTLTIAELVERIHGEILSGAEKSGELMENIMLGAMSVDSGLDYFGHKADKAVILRSERPDMQLAALQTPTRCLVLTGKMAPKPVVLHQAEDKKIPLILTRDDITIAVANIETALGQTRFNKEKLLRLNEIMEQHFDFLTVSQGLGFTG